jgi:ribosome-associated protein
VLVRPSESARKDRALTDDQDGDAHDEVRDNDQAAGDTLPADAVRALILTSLDEDKAEDVLSIDLLGKSSIADAMVIASGRSARHVAAMADHVLRKLKEAGHGRAKVEGLPNADWVLIDAGDVVTHLFRPEVRSFYAIERIWAGETPSQHGHG